MARTLTVPVKPGVMLEVPPPKTRDELHAVIKFLTGYNIPRKAVCPHHCAPFDYVADAYFAEMPGGIGVVKASRGLAGKSFATALVAWLELIFLECDVAVLGGSGAQSKRVHAYQRTFWRKKRAPQYLLLRATDEHTLMTDGHEMTVLMASETSVRGGHPQRTHFDEIDEMRLTLLDSALGMAMAGETNVKPCNTMTSTHQYADGTMTEMLKRSTARGYRVYEWCYKENMQTWLSPEEVAQKRAQVTNEMWRVEYEMGEPAIGNRAIDTNSVDAMFKEELGTFDGRPEEHIEIEPPAYDCGADDGQKCEPTEGQYETCATHKRENEARYAHGVDWAKEQDWTVIATLRVDTYPYRLVAYLRTGRKPWPAMAKNLDDRVRRYPGAVQHDATGIGNVIKDLLEVPATGVVLGGRKYDDLCSEYIKGIESGDIEAPRIAHMYGEHKYATMAQVFGTEHIPDSFIAGALAYRAARKRRRGFGPVI